MNTNTAAQSTSKPGPSTSSKMSQAHQKPTSVFGLCALHEGRVVGLPFNLVSRTQGKVHYMAHTNEHMPHVCHIFSRTRQCPHGETCQHLHVDHGYLEKLKFSQNNCCAYCGDPFSREVLRQAPALQLVGLWTIQKHLFPIERFALTACIQKFKKGAALDASVICLDHLNGHCPRSKDCQKFHPCRERMRQLTEFPSSNHGFQDEDNMEAVATSLESIPQQLKNTGIKNRSTRSSMESF